MSEVIEGNGRKEGRKENGRKTGRKEVGKEGEDRRKEGREEVL